MNRQLTYLVGPETALTLFSVLLFWFCAPPQFRRGPRCRHHGETHLGDSPSSLTPIAFATISRPTRKTGGGSDAPSYSRYIAIFVCGFRLIDGLGSGSKGQDVAMILLVVIGVGRHRSSPVRHRRDDSRRDEARLRELVSSTQVSRLASHLLAMIPIGFVLGITVTFCPDHSARVLLRGFQTLKHHAPTPSRQHRTAPSASACSAAGAFVCTIIGRSWRAPACRCASIYWFAGFFALIVVPQVIGHFYKALKRRKPKPRAPPRWNNSPSPTNTNAATRSLDAKSLFGPDVDPQLISDVRAAYGDVFAAADFAQFAVLPNGETVLLARFKSAPPLRKPG
jgi:hypothetical protein